MSAAFNDSGEDRVRYADSEIRCNFDFRAVLDSSTAGKRSRSAGSAGRGWAARVDALVQSVLDGDVCELDILRDKALGDTYARGQAKVDLALSFRARRDMHADVERLRAGLFIKTILWMQGASDQGKTWLAEGVASRLRDLVGWRVYRAAAKNAADDYAGEEIFLLNEPSSRALEWPDLLSLLDPRQAGPLSARFHNKTDAAPRVVIVAVSVDPATFGFFVPGKRSTDDSLDQLVRRISLLVEAEKVGGVPHYTLARIGEVAPISTPISIPSPGTEAPRTEVLRLSWGPTGTTVPLPRDTALDVVLAEVAERSPDAGLAVTAPPWAQLAAAGAARHESAMLDRAAEWGGPTVADHLRVAHLAGAATPDAVGQIFALTSGGVHCGLCTAKRSPA